MTSMTTADLEQLVEGHDLEAKLAAGRDGRGELPTLFFETGYQGISCWTRWGAP